jgi:signal transduction histidine kinase
MRFADSMFARTALLAAASGLVFAVLFLAVGRRVAGLPAIRASAATLAQLLERDPRAVAQSSGGPPPARLRDEALARTLLWRTFAGVLEEKLGPGVKLAIRADENGAVVWARIPASGNWARWHTELPSDGLRAGVLAMLASVAAAVLVGGVLLARQITGPLRQFIAYARSNYEEPFDLAVLDELVASAIRSRSFEGGVAFEPGAPVPALLQPGNVHALVEHLLENARKHGATPIHVRTRQSAGEVQLIVRDGGNGIPETDQVAALQPFVRLAEQEAPGSGLGLAIVARVAKRHNGRVEMRNGPDGFEVRATLSTAYSSP